MRFIIKCCRLHKLCVKVKYLMKYELFACLSAVGLVENGNKKWGLTLMSDGVMIR